MFCDVKTPARKRYERRLMVTMVCYVIVLLGAAHIVKHDHPHGWVLYFFSLLPAIPVIGTIGLMGRYLHEETDEYLKTIIVRSILIATTALLGTIVVSDFLRAYAACPPLEPFASFVTFYFAFAAAQGFQMLRERLASDE